MKLLPIADLGARDVPGQANKIKFGIILPGITSADGSKLRVHIIHELDQHIFDIKPMIFDMAYSHEDAYPEYPDFWKCEVTIDKQKSDDFNQKAPAKSHWGDPETYIYWYSLEHKDLNNRNDIEVDPVIGKKILNWINDPYAREAGKGKMSAFTLGYKQYQWSANEALWKTPYIKDLVVYEMMISEFAGTFDEAIKKLSYIKDLGFNAIEVMPVSNVAEIITWGYMPIGHFAIEERYGSRSDFQRFVDEAHKAGLAVILDVVYNHVNENLFCYAQIYPLLPSIKENPFIGIFEEALFGQGDCNFEKPLTSDFFFTVNYQWLDNFHVDGFRYDNVSGFYRAPVAPGYSELVYQTYQKTLKKIKNGSWLRFSNNGQMNLFQCAEYMTDPVAILNKTYSNSTWLHQTHCAARDLAKNGDGHSLYLLGLKGFGADGVPQDPIIHNNVDSIDKIPMQYYCTHDQKRFVCFFDPNTKDDIDNKILKEADRKKYWFKIQPYLIGLFTCRGIPLMWEGDEFVENYYVPDFGSGIDGRVELFRPLRWEKFYDPIGRCIRKLVRDLAGIHNSNEEFRYGSYYFHNDYTQYQSKGLLVFEREYQNKYSLVVLNFSNNDYTDIKIKFKNDGNYKEQILGDILPNINKKNEYSVKVPSNYGCIWTKTP